MSVSVFNLPETTKYFFDSQFLLYSVPLLGDIVRIATVVNNLNTMKLVPDLSPEDIKSTRIDIAKWVIAMIPSAILSVICPLTGIITLVIGIAAIIATLAEQAKLICGRSLAGRAEAL